LQQRVQEIPNDKPIVLVCARGGRSAMAADFMVSLGYENLYNLSDGTIGWILAGLPIERD
jgi:rhodanese-related sulfurtransferase